GLVDDRVASCIEPLQRQREGEREQERKDAERERLRGIHEPLTGLANPSAAGLRPGGIIGGDERSSWTARRCSSGAGRHFLESPGRARAATAPVITLDVVPLGLATLKTPAVEPALRTEELRQRFHVAGAAGRAADLRGLPACRARARRLDG